MNTPTKFAGFALGLVALFGVALGAGALAGTDDSEPETHEVRADKPATNTGPGGLASSDGGYTLVLADPITTATREATLRFRIEDSTGRPVTRYTPNHEKDLHLILVRRDTAGYQHLHPTLGPDGTWSTPVDLTRAGDQRVFADFVTADGQPFTLGADLRVAGRYTPQPLPATGTTATVDGYTVNMNGAVTPASTTDVTFTVTRAGKPVTDLQPYLGAYGHLVALRAADLGYLHVHPAGHPGDGNTAAGPGVTFAVTAPGTGDYRLFFEFRHNGTVHRAEFTVPVAETAGDPTGHTPTGTQTAPEPTGHGHGH
ncbi:hypothetical protein [Nocardia jinanensis]|uniref:DUF748 domain-containing protein n=1 Tax=Nocardia jinanensis TaxID=382504 RepID=A0A917RS45_9NOCA|nr:hypothetical protein [Nocardia jinanensis]GGL25427.1 hypothetical protein GCM10011588_45340 [Nocardia jinanensis]